MQALVSLLSSPRSFNSNHREVLIESKEKWAAILYPQAARIYDNYRQKYCNDADSVQEVTVTTKAAQQLHLGFRIGEL